MKRESCQAGFTLLEILVAMAIAIVVMMIISTTFITTLRARKEVLSLTESTAAGSRILNLIERDLRGLWIYNIKDNKVLLGRNMDLSSDSADRIDFLTTTDSVTTIANTQEEPVHTSICEVGYWLRPHPRYHSLMELWRREDPMVDEEIDKGGVFQKVHDRLRSFNITYFKTLGRNAEEIHEWDSSEEDSLPRVIKVEFTIERKLSSANEISRAEIEDFEDNNKKYVRFIVLDRDYPKILTPEFAMIPVIPLPPGSEEEGGENGGGGAGGGQGGPGDGEAAGGRSRSAGSGKGFRDSGGDKRGEGNDRGRPFEQPRNMPRGNNPLGGGNPFANGLPRGLTPPSGNQPPINLGEFFKQFR